MDHESNVTTVSLIVPRTARYARMGPEGRAVEQVWLVCHGYGQLADRFIRRFSAVDDGSRLIVAPEALSRFYVSGGSVPYAMNEKVGASWMTREGRDSEIEDQVTYLELVTAEIFEAVDRTLVRFVALGFSQGAGAVCRWAARSENPPDDVVAWGGAIPGDVLQPTLSQRLARARVTLVVGSEDPIANADRTKAHRAELDAAKLHYRFVSYEGGHDVDATVLSSIAADLRPGRQRI
ncbi:MAG: hypothetical protein H0W42_02800 [Gemmatimonadaceae bacterium]|nr:hypothetical protein [Gemmatimonadaceae bacterium]